MYVHYPDGHSPPELVHFRVGRADFSSKNIREIPPAQMWFISRVERKKYTAEKLFHTPGSIHSDNWESWLGSHGGGKSGRGADRQPFKFRNNNQVKHDRCQVGRGSTTGEDARCDVIRQSTVFCRRFDLSSRLCAICNMLIAINGHDGSMQYMYVCRDRSCCINPSN